MGDSAFPNFRDFEVTHNYLLTTSRTMQSRLRKRGRQGKYSYIHTIRKQQEVGGQVIEVKTPVSHREYSNLLGQTDPLHLTVNKTRDVSCITINISSWISTKNHVIRGA